MDKLYVDLGEKSYDIVFDTDFLNILPELEKIKAPKKLLIVTDSNVEKLWLSKLLDLLLENAYDVKSCVIPAGEENKNMDGILKICKASLEHKMDRKSMILALGGGVVGDMAGFAASMYMRGIRFVQIPTTLLSQSDSSVGGKTGIDFMSTKNILGAFFQPALVYINVSTLKTLPEVEFLSGMGEVIKHGIIKDKDFFEFLYENAREIKKLRDDLLIKMTKINCGIKAQVVMEDEKELGLRAILNFGHTIGHAVESAANFSKTHGECVAIGMVAASYIAQKRNLIDKDVFDKIISIIDKYGFDTKIDISREIIFDFMKNDKKSEEGRLKFVLPKELGNVGIFSDVNEEEIQAAIDFCSK